MGRPDDLEGNEVSRLELERMGLYDPERDTEERLALLRFNIDQGVSAEELLGAERLGRLVYVGGDPYIRPGGERLTVQELADRLTMSADEVARVWRTAGFPDPDRDGRVMVEADLEVLDVFRTASQLFGEGVALQLLRTMGSSLARVAEAEVTAFATIVGADLVSSADPLELARANVAVTRLLPSIARVLDVLHRHHIQSTVYRLMADPSSRESRTKQLAVGFADLVGFTAWTARADPRALARLVEDFAAGANDVIGEHGGRVVKMIGDEVMFVASDAVTACGVAAGLVGQTQQLEVPSQIRVGLACGEVLTLHGDYYGPVVNLAARLVTTADPGSVLAAADVERAARVGRPAWHFRPGGPRILKGFPTPVEVYELLITS